MLVCQSPEIHSGEVLSHTVSTVAHLLHWWLLNLHLHLQAHRSLPTSCTSTLWDDLGDSDHFWRNFEESGEVLDQVISKEFILSHSRELKGYDENRGSSDLHWLGASHQYLQHLVILVKVVCSQNGTKLRNMLT